MASVSALPNAPDSTGGDGANRLTGAAVVEPVALDGGWRGLVVPRRRPGDSLPAAEGWRGWLARLVTDPTGLPGYVQLKYSPKNEVVRAQLGAEGGPEVICKRSSPGGLRARVAGAVGASRARRNFDRGLLLSRLGIGTALPLAIVERRRAGECWLVTEYLDDVVDLDAIALTRLPHLSPFAAYTAKCALVRALAALFRALDRHGLHHRDLKATNVLIRGWGGADMQAVLVDLDGLRTRSRWASRNRDQRLTRLAASLADYPAIGRTDYARFLRHLTDDPDREAPVAGSRLAQAVAAGGSPPRESTTCPATRPARRSHRWKAQMRRLAAAAERYNRSAARRLGRKWADDPGA